MSSTFDFDRLLESTLRSHDPQTLPEKTIDVALAEARAVTQRRPRVSVLDGRAWPADTLSRFVRPARLDRRLAGVLLLAIITAATVATVVVGSALLRKDPTIELLESSFVHPFEYAIPAESGLRRSGWPYRDMVAWTSGPADRPYASDETVDVVVQPQAGEVRGVVVGLGDPAMSHGAGRFILATAPTAFLTELRDETGVRMDAIVETTFDGRPAAMAQLPGVGGSDVHPGADGLVRSYVRVTFPSRLIVTEVDGTTIFIYEWARDARELEAWLPVADEFVASIHFRPE